MTNIIDTQTEITTLSATDLENVTGGVAWGPLLTRAATWAGGLFGGGGGGGGTNVNIQNGSNNRNAQGNQGPVSLGDNSPITQGQ